jgi:hypothetical protein
MPDELEDEEEIPKPPTKRAERRIVLDDDYEELESPGIQSARPEKPKNVMGSKENIPSALKAPNRERAYKLVPKFDDANIVRDLVGQTKGMRLEGITVEMMSAMNGEYAKGLRDITFKVRKPLKPKFTADAMLQGDAFPFMEEETPLKLDWDAIALSDLPPVDSVFVSHEEDMGLLPGCLVATDIVLQYYSTLGDGQAPKQIYTSMESASLRVLFPKINGQEKVECVVDSGSQIVSMALKSAEGLGLSWDPDVTIFMQSANGQLKKSAGLARNVLFLFGDIPIYLQVHIIDQPAYYVLLGRPFDILSETNIQNFKDGSQSITIRDPNTQRRITLPTHARGKFQPSSDPRVTIEEVRDEDDPPRTARAASGVEKEADFQGSSRN